MKRPPPPKLVQLPRLPPLRVLVLAAAAIVATVWAIVHHYTRPHPPMLVPVPAASEIPAPPVIEAE